MFDNAEGYFMKMMSEEMDKLKTEREKYEKRKAELNEMANRIIKVLDGVSWAEAEVILDGAKAMMKLQNKVRAN